MCVRDDCRKKHKIVLNKDHNVKPILLRACIFPPILTALWRAYSYRNCSRNVSLQYTHVQTTYITKNTSEVTDFKLMLVFKYWKSTKATSFYKMDLIVNTRRKVKKNADNNWR